MKPKCGFQGCNNVHLAKGMCLGHYEQKRRGEQLHTLANKNKRIVPSCSVTNCTLPHMAKGFCRKHWTMNRTIMLGTDDSRCLFKDCRFISAAKGLCYTHYSSISRLKHCAETLQITQLMEEHE